MDTKNGTIIDGRYEFISTLGKGALGAPLENLQTEQV